MTPYPYTEYGVRSTVCARSLKLSNVAPGSLLDGTASCCIHSWGSENHVNQMARLTDFKLDVKNLNGRRRSSHPARPQKYPQHGVLGTYIRP